jgi:cytochrome c oxidase subunit 2
MPARFQSVLDAAGAQAARVEALWWLMFWVCAVVWILVVVALGAAILRGRTGAASGTGSRRITIAIAAATAVTIVALVGLLTASAFTGRDLRLREAHAGLVVQITGHQWWWDIQYQHPDPSLRVTTANELHVPVGRPVTLQLKSADVIHSFWVPNLHGKMDLVPGRLNTTWFEVDRPGEYRGQCAEYCGLQHAHMGLVVIAHEPAAFETWIAAQRRGAPRPSTPEAVRGLALVEQGPCMMCHAVRGTAAGGRTAPDLTHFASRRTIAAATVPNTPEHLERWLIDPQAIKPGNRMPPTGLSAADVRALVAYLETLR